MPFGYKRSKQNTTTTEYESANICSANIAQGIIKFLKQFSEKGYIVLPQNNTAN